MEYGYGPVLHALFPYPGAGALLAVTACVAALLAPAQTADAATVPAGPVFNKPTGTTSEQQAIRAQVRSVIANADSGSVLRLAMYHLWDETIATELGAAKARGVGVKVVLDESTRAASATARGRTSSSSSPRT